MTPSPVQTPDAPPGAADNVEVLEGPVLAPGALGSLEAAFRAALAASGDGPVAAKRSYSAETRKFYLRDPRAFRLMLSVLEAPAVARAVRARAALPYVDHMDLLIKEPGAPETPWHQDRPYWAWDEPPSMFTIWVALMDIEPADGCLRVAGSGVRDVFPHRMLEYGPARAFSALSIDPERFDVGTLEARELPLRAGCAVVFDSFAVHSAWPNTSGRPRLSFKVVLGDRERCRDSERAGVIDLGSGAYRLNRRLGFLPAFVAFNVREALESRTRRAARRQRRRST